MSIAEKLTTIAENEQRVYDAGWHEGREEGYSLGKTEGYTSGYDNGVAFESDLFWDFIQNWGNRTYYAYAFAYWGWVSCDPKYTIGANNTTAMSMFQGNTELRYINWEKFDFSGVTTFNQAFNSCFNLQSIDIDLATTTALANAFQYTFSGCNALTRIQKITARPEFTWVGTFNRCDALTDITFDGTIANSIDFQHSAYLTYNSLESIMRALSFTSTGKTITFNKTAIKNAYGWDVDDETTWGSIYTNEFTSWIDIYSNWTISVI